MRKYIRRLPASLALALIAPYAQAAPPDGAGERAGQHHLAAPSPIAVPDAQQAPGQLAVPGNTPLIDLLDGLVLPKLEGSDRTVADLFARAHPRGSRVGSKATLGPLAFVAREVAGGRVVMSGVLVSKNAAAKA